MAVQVILFFMEYWKALWQAFLLTSSVLRDADPVIAVTTEPQEGLH
jgi:hypothetical protein